MGKHVWVTICLVLVMNLWVSPTESFFFGSLFRRQSQTASSNRDHTIRGGEVLNPQNQGPPHQRQHQRSGPFHTENRPPPPRDNVPSGTGENPNFHVPKSLCIACEEFPWMPVANEGDSKPLQTQEGQIRTQSVVPGESNRRPFAIQAHGSKSQGNIVGEGGKSSGTINEQGFGPRPVTTVNFQAEFTSQDEDSVPPTVGKPFPPPGTVWHPTSRPATFYQTGQTIHVESQVSQGAEPAKDLRGQTQQEPNRFQPPSTLQQPLPSGPAILQPSADTTNYAAHVPTVLQPTTTTGTLPPPPPPTAPAPPAVQNYGNFPQEAHPFRQNGARPEFGLQLGPVPPAPQQFTQQPTPEQRPRPGFQVQEVIPGKLIYQDHIRVEGGQNQQPPPGPQLPQSVSVPILSPEPAETFAGNQIPLNDQGPRFQQAPGGMSFLLSQAPRRPEEEQRFQHGPPQGFLFNQQFNQQFRQPFPAHQQQQPFPRPSNQMNAIVKPESQGGYRIIVPVGQFGPQFGGQGVQANVQFGQQGPPQNPQFGQGPQPNTQYASEQQNNIDGMLPPAPPGGFRQVEQYFRRPSPPSPHHAAVPAIVNGLQSESSVGSNKFLAPYPNNQGGSGPGVFLFAQPPQIFGLPAGNTLSPEMRPPAPYPGTDSNVLSPSGPTRGPPEIIYSGSPEINNAPAVSSPAPPGPPPQPQQDTRGQGGGYNDQIAFGQHVPYFVEVQENRNVTGPNRPPFIPEGNSIIIQHGGQPQFVPIPVPNFGNGGEQGNRVEFSPYPQNLGFIPSLNYGGGYNGGEASAPSPPSPTGESLVGVDVRGRKPGPGEQSPWEIIPAKQYDITNLFSNPPTPASPESTVPIPVPVPITFSPSASRPTPPVFLVSSGPAPTGNEAPIRQGSEDSQASSLDDIASASSQNEEIEKNVVTSSGGGGEEATPPPAPATWTQSLSVKFPVLPGTEQGPTQFDPLPPSIVTALHHAQRTSFLTHSHLLGGMSGQGAPSAVYVHSVPVMGNEESEGGNRQAKLEDGDRDKILNQASSEVVEKNVIEPTYTSTTTENPVDDQLVVGCGGHDRWVIPYGQRVHEFGTQPRNTPPVAIFFPSPLRQSSVQWNPQQQPGFSQSVNQFQFAPLPNAQSFGAQGQNVEMGQETMFSSPIFGWSPKIVQTFNSLATPSQTPPGKDADLFVKVSPPKASSTPTPYYHILSVGKDNTQGTNIQSLEESPKESGTNFIPSPPVKFKPSPTVVTKITTKPMKESDCIKGDCEVTATATITTPTSEETKPLESVEESKEVVQLDIGGPTTTAECVTEGATEYQSQENLKVTVTELPITSTPPVSIVYPSNSKEFGSREKIRVRVGARFPAGRPAIQSSTYGGDEKLKRRPIFKPSAPIPDSSRGESLESSESLAISSVEKATGNGGIGENTLLNLEDIYKKSEGKQEGGEIRDDAAGSTSTERSSSFSVSVASSSPLNSGSIGRNTSRKLYGSNPSEVVQGLSVGVESTTPMSAVGGDVSSAGAGVSSGGRFSSSSSVSSSGGQTESSSPSSMVTKVVKTVRVRQRMRPGGNGGGQIRNRFSQGGGRVRVVQRPITQEYVKSFPEFATPEGDSLGKEEEEEVKNALIDLKKVSDRRYTRSA